MPRYLVRLETPVVYQPDSLKARREVTELEVLSDTEADAVSHVHRTTRGRVTVATIEVLDKTASLAAAAARAAQPAEPDGPPLEIRVA